MNQLAESPSASGLTFGERSQQDEQGKFVEIGYSPSNWRLDDLGGTDAKNSEYLAVAPVGNDGHDHASDGAIDGRVVGEKRPAPRADQGC